MDNPLTSWTIPDLNSFSKTSPLHVSAVSVNVRVHARTCIVGDGTVRAGRESRDNLQRDLQRDLLTPTKILQQRKKRRALPP